MYQKNWKDLIRPKRLEVEKELSTPFYGKFTAEPLERGFGITIGNSLRRILLSSLQGAAIASVKFDGVLHEFSAIPGVKEDVTEIILNLKEVRLKLHSEGPKTIRVKAEGAKRTEGRRYSDRRCRGDPQSGASHCYPFQGQQAFVGNGGQDWPGLCSGGAK